MRPPLASLHLVEPKSLTEALQQMRKDGPLVPIAGGTDLYVTLNFGTLKAKRFLNLVGLKELTGIRLKKHILSIGSRTTYSELIQSSIIQKHLPILVEAARQVGGLQIQNRGTIGGNIANASPAGDTLPVLAVAEATIVLRNLEGERRVPFHSFYTGYRQMVMKTDELIMAIEIPLVEGRQWFRKVGTRAAQAISKVVMAAVFGTRPRLAFGSVAPTVVRCPKTEEVLAKGGTVEEAKRSLLEEIKPIDDIRSTAEYRQRVCANLLEAALENHRS